ncbi:ABC-type bacteriocin/lantibiotic exporter, contains an N-terminal double-glycine peptidase domain [Filomicrobium insigne]|uniref:ABC-type bacteriocin/lantibiotic exporter, contains an N-terminal double-glycine peptidase domain n=1 Tax=Filomicrobium insigne TaxID=418854 RepID=A0A1H0UB37_9HYPH|nr:ABC transporter ATP-binding protein [Filomicrobium insigne]SDP63383.1 ABC-type bacteriocin/lantibiotic exporter, contains an N-terminal double-glycine peptidase domain [Filomicrobium insigne]
MRETISKLSDLLDRREKWQALLLLVLMLALGLVEMVGVASILPLIAVLSDPSIIQTNPYLRWAYEALGFSSVNSFLIVLAALVFLVIVVRTGVTAVTSYGVLRYAQMRSHALSVKLLTSYLRRPYAWFLNRHSADMGKSVLSEVEQVVNESLMPCLQLVSRLIITLFITGLVVVIEPVVAIGVLVGVSLAYGLVFLAVSTYLRRLGKERVAANRARYQIAQEVLGGVKEVKIGGLEPGYVRRFSKASQHFARLRSRFQLVREVPRHLLELVAIGGVLVVILVLLFRADGNLKTALPIIALYAFAGLRLLPAVQTIYQSLVALRFGGPALDALHRELCEADGQASDWANVVPLPLRSQIELDHVDFSYPQAGRPALRDVSLRIPVHTSVGIVGETGAGKSTLVDIILGLLEPQNGRLRVDDVPIERSNVRAWQRSVGYVPQHIFLADESIAANIAFGVPLDKIDQSAVERAARMAKLHDFVMSELPHGYATEVGERGVRLSGGQRQRVGIARALYHDPDVLVLDEATSALDNRTEKAVMDAVNNLAHRKTIIMIAHRLTTVSGCDAIFMVERGAVRVAGQGELGELGNAAQVLGAT